MSKHSLTTKELNEITKTVPLSSHELDLLWRKLSREYLLTPNNLAVFIAELGEYSKGDVILDPFCRLGDILQNIKLIAGDVNLVGFDIERELIEWAKIIASYKGLKINYDVIHEVSDFPKVYPKKAKYIFSDLTHYDYVASKGAIERSLESNNIRNFISMISKHLETGGLAFLVVPENALISEKTKPIRDLLKDRNQLKAIISLPAGTFSPYSNIKTSILVLGEMRNNLTALYKLERISANSPVVEDFQNFIKTGKTNLASISYKYVDRENWSVENYLDEKSFNERVKKIPCEHVMKELGDLVDLEYINPKDLINKNEKLDFLLTSRFKVGEVLENKEEIYNKTNKATYIAVSVKSDLILPEYIKAVLKSNFGVSANKRRLNLGSIIESLRISNLKDFQIPIVNIEKQLEIVEYLNTVNSKIEEISILQKRLETAVKENLFEINQMDLMTTEADENIQKEGMPQPIANGYFSYINKVDIDEKLENSIIFFEIMTNFIGMMFLVFLARINYKKIPEEIRKVINPISPITVGTWGRVISLGLNYLDKGDSFLSDYKDKIDISEVNRLIGELTKTRNDKSHLFKSISEYKKRAIYLDLEIKLEKLLNNFMFIADYPLVYIKGNDRFPNKILYHVRYLIGDTMTPRENDEEIQDDFYNTLYLLSNKPNKSLQLYPLIIYEDCKLLEAKDIYFFRQLDDKGNPVYRSYTKASEITRKDLRDDVHKIFYYIPKEYSKNV